MSSVYKNIFSEYDITKWGVKFSGDATATVMDTLGSMEEALEVRTVTKLKRNMPWKTRTKATGSGQLTLSCHIAEDVYANMFGMFVDGYKPGVMVYGQLSVHEQFCMSMLVEDEDGKQKLKAYPCCTIKEGISRSVETNGETVAEVSLTVSVDPDSDGNGMYSMVVVDSADEAMINTWINNFSAASLKTSTPSA